MNAIFAHCCAGTLAGAVATFAFYPMDTIRSRWQAMDGTSARGYSGVLRYMSIPGSIRHIVRTEGLRPLYKGVYPAVVGASLAWGIYFGLFRYFQSTVRRDASWLSNFGCGLIAGIITAVSLHPVWLVKTHLQLNPNLTGVSDAVKNIVAKRGLPGLMRGLTPALLMTSHGAIQMASYETIKTFLFAEQLCLMESSPDSANSQRLNVAGVLLCSTVSKSIAALVTNPLLLIKTRMQDPRMIGNAACDAQYASLSSAFMHILKTDGPSGFFRGAVPHLARVVPSACLTFVVYENLHAFLKTFVQ